MKLKYIKSILLVAVTAFVYVGCSKDGSTSSSDGGGSGVGGSTARFTIAGNYMYTVDDQQLHIFDISNPSMPVESGVYKIGTRIETIFNLNKTLFIGSQSGMYIFDISNPTNLDQKSVYTHIESCDPVVADSAHAFVTLKAVGRRCSGGANRLDIIDIKNLNSLDLIGSYSMTSPDGLGVDKNQLFVCDNGLKVFDISNINSIQQKHNFLVSAHDVIPYMGRLYLIGDKALSQYSYNNDTILLLSQIKF